MPALTICIAYMFIPTFSAVTSSKLKFIKRKDGMVVLTSRADLDPPSKMCFLRYIGILKPMREVKSQWHPAQKNKMSLEVDTTYLHHEKTIPY